MKHHSDKSILDWVEEHPTSITINRGVGAGEFTLVWDHAATGDEVNVTAPSLRQAVSQAIEVDARALGDEEHEPA